MGEVVSRGGVPNLSSLQSSYDTAIASVGRRWRGYQKFNIAMIMKVSVKVHRFSWGDSGTAHVTLCPSCPRYMLFRTDLPSPKHDRKIGELYLLHTIRYLDTVTYIRHLFSFISSILQIKLFGFFVKIILLLKVILKIPKMMSDFCFLCQ